MQMIFFIKNSKILLKQFRKATLFFLQQNQFLCHPGRAKSISERISLQKGGFATENNQKVCFHFFVC